MREIESSHGISGFTPLFDVLVQRYDLATAAVYGRVWRFCQMRNKSCYASISKIASSVGIGYNTALRRLKLLVSEGYLTDETPGRRNVPHVYRLTGALDIEHVSETRVVESPSSPRERDDPSSTTEGDPSSTTEGDPSSTTEGDEDTQDTTTNNGGVVLSDDQRHALNALREIGFVPEADAIKFAQGDPARALGWATYARAEGLGGGFVRKQLAAGNDPPAVEERLPQSTGEVWR